MEETTKKKAGRPKKVQDNTVNNSVKKEENVVKKIKKEKLVLNDSDEMLVKSNVFGGLLYINHKTGDETNWENEGDIQPLTVRDLRDMKAKQVMFYKENWISIVGSDDVDFDIYSIDDVYEALQVKRYYEGSVIPTNTDDVFSWSIEKMRENFKLMPVSIRETIIIRANDKIKEGSLDSIAKVKAIEEILNCELASPND